MARITTTASLFAFAVFCFDASAVAQQSSIETRLVIRSAGIAGVAPVSFDLNQTSTQRFALIIGNGDYDNAPDLPNAVADAQLIAQTLRQGEYTVAEHYNLDKRAFEAAMRQMLFEAELGAEILIYYAGHGVQVGGRNYILPTDSDVTSVYDLPFEAVSLQGILALASSRARSVVSILDSCRDNPFPDKKLSVDLDGVPASIRNGFNPQESPINSLVVFSTSPGSVALDGQGKNSPFTRAMVDAIHAKPDVSFDELLKDIRRDVYERTYRLQLPWQSSSLVEPVYLMRRTSPVSGDTADTGDPAQDIQTTSPMAISATLNPKVPIGQDMAGIEISHGVSDVTLMSQPVTGRIEMRRAGQLIELPEHAVLQATDLENLVYRPASQANASGTRALKQVQDHFDVQADRTRYSVAISLNVDQCDREAGDHLDPEGVGFAVYPNEINPQDALAACLIAVQSDPLNGRFQYQLGRAYLALRDLDKATVAYRKAQDLGHTRAYQGLGLLEIAKVEATQGRLSGRASDRALGYFAAGVDRGDPYAYHSLGLQLLRHPTSENDQLHGFELLSRSLELGHTFSMNALGLYFLDTDEPHYDPQRGLRYLQGSAGRGDIYGIANLGYVYANDPDRKDPDRARDYFEQAAAGGHPTAPTSLGRLYVSGDLKGGVDLARAIDWYDQGLERGDSWGGANAAWIIANRRVAGYAAHDAAVRAAKAAALRNPAAAAAAREVLAALPGSALDAGAQTLMHDLGVEIEIDGAFGAISREKLAELAAASGKTIPQDRRERLLVLARLYWEQSQFRVDLY